MIGQPWEIGIKRFSPAISDKGLTIKALPLRKDSPVYIEPANLPQFDAKGEAVRAVNRGIAAIGAATEGLERLEGRVPFSYPR